MISGMEFEAMKSLNPEVGWATVTKGRRTMKSIARSINGVVEAGNSPSPSRVEDFLGPVSDQFGATVTGQSTSGKSESVPIKKRRNLLPNPPPHTRRPSESSEHEYNDVGDFSGIELLAAAASMDNDCDNAKNVDLDVVHPLILKYPNTTNSASQCELGLKTDESETCTSMTMNGGNTDCSLVLSNSVTVSHGPCEKYVEMETMPKIDRQHWDLNSLMDTWDDPYASIARNTSNDDVHIQDMKDRSNTAQEVSDQAAEKDTGEGNPDQVLVGDTQKDTSDQVVSIDAMVDSSLSKVCSSVMMSEEKISAISVNDAMNRVKNCSSNVSESERTTSSVIQAVTQDITVHPMPVCEISETDIDTPCKDIRDSLKACEPPGAMTQDGLSVLPSDSKIQNDGTFAPRCVITDFQGQVEPTEFVAKRDDNNLCNEGSRKIALEESCKSSVATAQCDVELGSSSGKIGSSLDAQHDSDVSQTHNFHAVDGIGLAKRQDVYDSPYEDGELRGSFLYSWEDNELEVEGVDYESDGRNGDGSEAADYHYSVTFEGGCEGSYGNTQRRSLFVKQSHVDNGNKRGSVKEALSLHFVKDDSDNNEIAGKGSTAGSGTTVEEPMEMDIKENDDIMKISHLTDNRKKAQMYKHASKTVRGKLQSRIEGWSSSDPTVEKDAFIQECRSQRFRLLYSQPERGTYPGKHLGRYKPSTHGERGGVYHSTSRGSRKQYFSSFQGAEGRSYPRPRNITGDSDKMGGLGYRDPRQATDYLTEGLHRPFMRSPEEGDGYFGMQRRRMSSTRGTDNYRRSRGYCLHRAGTDFMEHLESLHDETNIPVRLPHYLSTRERSFSPNSGRSTHVPSPCKRSRSKSRTRSPGRWHSHREHVLNTRRHNRSPDFRSEARMDRLRVSFPKPPFTHCRWVDDGVLTDNHSGRRRSPMRTFRRNQRFDVVGSSGRLKSDEYFRPMFRSERFSFMTNGGRGYKLESNYDNKRRYVRDQMICRGPNSNDNGNVQQFRYNIADNYGTSNLNDGNDVRLTAQRDAPQIQGVRDEKRALKI